MPNRLIHQTSPYLLQHAHNPVDWYPWGDEAFEQACQADKPIFLSIGYAACHWCHVMEKESFEDPAIAAILNQNFINIKVDREERPDVDHIYMSAVVAMTGQGGWPLNIFLTPEKRPFYGGTYFPPVSRYRLPSFLSVLEALSLAWKTDREKLLHSSDQVTHFLRERLASCELPETKADFNFSDILTHYEQSFDWTAGGWGNAPKFPHPMALDFLLQISDRFPTARVMAMRTLRAMQQGGLFDIVGGGFHRYSTDAGWRTPHFEKMLSDNALLALVYLHAYQLTGEPDLRHTCEQTLDFILREMTSPDGAFFASLDADSADEEGLFYTWTQAELAQVITDPAAYQKFMALHQPFLSSDERAPLRQSEKFIQVSGSVRESIQQNYASLLDVRNQRVRPAEDDKVIVSFNALALRAFAEAGRFLSRDDYLRAAQKNGDFLLSHLVAGKQLNRAWRNGVASQPAMLEDYASLNLALIALYQADFNSTWLEVALTLAETMMDKFADTSGIFFDVPPASNDLLFRPVTWEDNALPSAMSMAASVLLWLSSFYHQPEWQAQFERLTRAALTRAMGNPLSYSSWLQNANTLFNPIEQIAILYPLNDLTHKQLIQSVNRQFRPNRIIAASAFPPSKNAPDILQSRPLIGNQATFYFCSNFACQRPLTDPVEVERFLNG